MRLEGKVAVIVGAEQSPGEGIGNGRATTLRFAQEGARILAVDRLIASAEETAAMGDECRLRQPYEARRSDHPGDSSLAMATSRSRLESRGRHRSFFAARRLKPNDLSRPLVALDQDSTIIAVIELSQSADWLPVCKPFRKYQALVTATIPVGSNPVAFGIFILPRFAGTPGSRR